jgi:hypothetical protein
VSAVSRLIHPGMSTRGVMRAVGKPFTRLGRTFGFCARDKGHPAVRMEVVSTAGGKVVALRRGRCGRHVGADQPPLVEPVETTAAWAGR